MLANGAQHGLEFDPVLLNRSVMEHAKFFPERRKRGRKRKAEKMAELAMAEALAKRQQARVLANVEPDSRVPVINLEDGSRLSGDEAPLKKDLDKWLDDHPGFMVDRPDNFEDEDSFLEEPLERKRGRRPRVDPMLLDPTKLTGDENVSVINRLTGKKITGAKAPPLRYLAEWLEQNPLYDVEPKWAELVKSKGSLPKTLLSRLGTPLERRNRGRPPRESNMSSSLLSENPFAAVSMAGLSAFPAASLMSGFPKLPIGMPFGALPNIGMGNPLLGLSGFGIPGLNMASVLSKSSESESKKDKDVSPNKKEQSKSESKSPSSITPHPSFPMLYNPLMFNPLLAAQAAQAAQAQGLNFSLPTSLPTSFATLAQAGLMNGQGDSDLEEGEIKRYSKVEQDAAEDLSVKSSSAKRSKEDRHERHHRHKRERHHDKSVSKISVSHFQDEPTDLSMKPKSSSHIDSQKSSNSSTPKESSNKMKTKIQSSFKLNKIVDSLKDKVQKMETKTDLKDKRSKLDDILSRMGGGSSKNTEKEESVENDNDHDQSLSSNKSPNKSNQEINDSSGKDEEMSEKNDDSMMSDS